MLRRARDISLNGGFTLQVDQVNKLKSCLGHNCAITLAQKWG